LRRSSAIGAVASGTVRLKDQLAALRTGVRIPEPHAGLPKNNGHRQTKTERHYADHYPHMLMHGDGNPSSRLAPILIPAKDSNPSQWMPQIAQGIVTKNKRQKGKAFLALLLIII
jgi:hypothetical protein